MVCSGRGLVFGRVEIVTWLWIVCALATLALSQQNTFYTHGRYGKRDESYAQASPFFSGSRYGRSGATNGAREPKSQPKLLEVSPRLDRGFFLGSRYGKRGMSINNNIQPTPRISSMRRFEQALGYLDRAQDAAQVIRTRDNCYEQQQQNRNNNVMDIPNEDERNNFW